MELFTITVLTAGVCTLTVLWLRAREKEPQYVYVQGFRRSQIQEFLDCWFHPNGKYVKAARLIPYFRATREDELYHCCHTEHGDPQSGPIYCSAVADLVAIAEDGSHYATCNRCRGRMRKEVKTHRSS